MRNNQNLYEYLYQTLVSQFKNGAFLQGQKFLSQQEICMQYNVGITTVRKVIKMLDREGYIHTAKGQLPVVTFQEPDEKYIAYSVQRRDEIADAYRGLEVLMPILYREGAKRCTRTDLDHLQQIIDGISEQMSLDELYKQANEFFISILRPIGNHLIMDLELDSENYLRIPYISVPGVENPFALTVDRLKSWLQNSVSKIKTQKFNEFCDRISNFYQESAKRIDNYLCALSRQTPAQTQIKVNVNWFRIKGRSELYARLAMAINRRIVAGEFNGQKYLPSIPKLMEEYGVMKNTASRAVALLNSLGFAQTLDKKGSVIALNCTASVSSGIDLTEPAIQERLALFMDALQIMTLTAKNCAASFSSMPDSLAQAIEDSVFKAQRDRISPLSVQLLMNSFTQLLPYQSLKNIFQQLEELIIWGHYLQAVDKSLYPDSRKTFIAMEELVSAIKRKDHNGLADAYGKTFSLIYEDVCQVISKLPLPLGKDLGNIYEKN